MNFDYTAKTNKDFDQIVRTIEKEAVRAGFKVLHIHDVQKNRWRQRF